MAGVSCLEACRVVMMHRVYDPRALTFSTRAQRVKYTNINLSPEASFWNETTTQTSRTTIKELLGWRRGWGARGLNPLSSLPLNSSAEEHAQTRMRVFWWGEHS